MNHAPSSDCRDTEAFTIGLGGSNRGRRPKQTGYDEVTGARIGKIIDLEVATRDEARIREMCDKLLANPVIESYQIEEVTD